MRGARGSDAREELLALYRELDELFAGWTCEASATCCRFARTGREPQLWPIEWKLLGKALRARPGKRPEEEGDCPGLDPATLRCRVYEARPFGCRTYFCDRAIAAGRNPREGIRELARRLADLAERDEKGARLLPLRTWAKRR